MDFSFGFGLGSSAYLLSGYNPLINYDWSTTTTRGLRYLKDVGSTPIYNASMYFGRGAYLNGVDQTITVPINTTIQTALKRVNGIVTINETSQTLTDYVISGLGVHKDYYLFTRLLTTAEKDSYINTPELFYAMAQADSTCVLNMPMCETDKYVRNMKTYSVSATNLFTSGFSAATNSMITDITNGYSIVKTSSDTITWMAITNTKLVAETIVKMCFNFTLVAGSTYPVVVGAYTSRGLNSLSTPYQVKEGYNELVVPSWVNTRLVYLQITPITSTFTWNFTNIIVNALSGIYPIQNYTSSVRDNAKNLQYGLQTCKFVRDSLGVIQSASNYLECDGVGYIKTQWVPTGTDVFTLETVITPALVSKLQTHGNYGTSINEVQIGVTSSNLVFASSLNSETVYLPYTENMHVCIVSDGVQSYYYCNNVLIKTTYNNSGSTVNPFAFGGVNSGTIFNPTYDTLRLFKIHAIAYTSSQVDAAYYALAKKNTIAYDVIPDECLYDENGNVYIDESGNYIGVDGYVMDESGEYYIV